jgi:hypothetical protein
MFAETEVNFTAQFFLVKSGCHKVISLMGTQSNVSGNGNERDENYFFFVKSSCHKVFHTFSRVFFNKSRSTVRW